MTDRREGFTELIRNPLMGLILLVCIAGGTAIGFWIEPVVGWLCVGVFAAGVIIRLIRLLVRRRRPDQTPSRR